MLEAVARELAHDYADRRIAVESHTDSGPVRSTQFSDSHQLSFARATAVFDHLTRFTPFRAEQLSVVGVGPNRPQFSNGTPAGQQRNRRIELVIYPERVGTSR